MKYTKSNRAKGANFKNRVSELKLLNGLYEKGAPKLIILYGRRRVGKTELLKEFLKKHKGLYILARQESEREQLRSASRSVAEFFNDDVLRLSPFSSWDALFAYIASKPRMPVVFDEFPYMVQSSKKVTSILQDHWDNNLSEKNAFIVLCGSSMSMMERLLGHKSPIYGRRTEQMLLEPLNFRDACRFFPERMPFREKVMNYAVLGGMPAYLLEFNFDKGIRENILRNVLMKNRFLFQDVLFTLREELKEPKNYFSILYSISKGNTRPGQIVNDTGFEKSFVNKYLDTLSNLHIIERRVPVTEKNASRSRNGIYVIKDNFFRFWFRFVFENLEYVEQGRQENLVDNKILMELGSFAGHAFEEVAISELVHMDKYKDYIFGRWWDRKSEVDILGIDRIGRKLLIGEAKLGRLKDRDIERISKSLKEKSSKINASLNFSEKFIIVCSGFDGPGKAGEKFGVEIIAMDKL